MSGASRAPRDLLETALTGNRVAGSFNRTDAPKRPIGVMLRVLKLRGRPGRLRVKQGLAGTTGKST
jgi:hypothetical protein